MKSYQSSVLALVVGFSLVGCGSSGGGNNVNTGGAASSMGGDASAGGVMGTGGSNDTGGASTTTGGDTASNKGGTPSVTGGAKATGGAPSATGGAASTAGGTKSTTGGTKAAGGTAATGGTTASASTGGAAPTAGASGTVFSQCRFHFGCIDSFAKNNATIAAEIDMFTPGWMMGTFNQKSVCTEATSGALAGKVPADVTYIAANYVKNQNQLCDCNVSGCAGGDLCTYGAQYITQDWATIISQYTSNSTGFAACLGGRPIIFELEPDWYQYTGGSQTQKWTVQQAATNLAAIVAALKSSLPQARFSMDISPWIGNNGAAWYPSFDMTLFTFISTSGGGTDANNTKIRSNNSMTWAGVSTLTGKPILADTGYGAAGSPAGEDTVWNDPTNINARMADGVVSITQYNPTTSWGTTIAGIRSQLNQPKFCP